MSRRYVDMEDFAPRLPGAPLAPPAPPVPPAAPAFRAPTPTPAAHFFEAAPPSPWAPAVVPAPTTASTAVPAFLGAAPAPASPFAPPGQSTLPPPTLSAPLAPAPPVYTPLIGEPHAHHAGGPEPVAFAPVSTAKKSRGPFMAVMALIVVVAVGLGAFMMLRGGPDERLTDDSTVLVPDPAPDESADFSFSTAAAQAEAAGSMTIDFSAQSPEGPVTGVITVDRATRRMSVELDLSQLVPADDDFIEIPDSYTMIIDNRTATMYVGSEALGGFIDIGTAWLSASTEQGDAIGGDMEAVFANPFDIADALVGSDPVDLGAETIDGEELRHYRVTSTVAGSSAEDEPGTEPWVDPAAVEYDVWVTKDSEIRRIEYDYSEDGEELRFEMTLRSSAEAVDIALPDPADVTDFAELFEMDNEVEFEFDDDTTTIDGETTTIDYETTITIDSGAAEQPSYVGEMEDPEPAVLEIDAPSVTAEAMPPGEH